MAPTPDEPDTTLLRIAACISERTPVEWEAEFEQDFADVPDAAREISGSGAVSRVVSQ